MKKILIPIITISFLITLLAIISSWFITYEPATKAVIYQALFCLLGTLYFINGLSAEENKHKIIFIICGIFIISIGFINRSLWINLLGVIAILTPIIIRRLNAKPISKP